jgi:hypothetical protein
MTLSSDVVVIFLSSEAVVTPAGQFLDCATVVISERYYFHMVTEKYRNSLECGPEIPTSSLSWLGGLDLSQEKCSDYTGRNIRARRQNWLSPPRVGMTWPPTALRQLMTDTMMAPVVTEIPVQLHRPDFI